MLPALLLAACATAPPKVWMRADGKSASGDPALVAKFQSERAQCMATAYRIVGSQPAPAVNNTIVVEAPQRRSTNGLDFIDTDTFSDGYRAAEAARGPNADAALSAQFEGCMAQRGYLWVAKPAAQ